MPERRVVITGMAAITPLGCTLKAQWDALCAGKSGISRIQRFDPTPHRTQVAGEIKNFDPSPFIPARDLKRIDRFAVYALSASVMALEDSGLHLDEEDRTRCGVIVGCGVGGLEEMEDAQLRLLQGPTKLSPLMIPRMMVNAASGQVSIRFGLRGPISAVSTACASGANAIGDAFLAIQRSYADVMIAGGTEAPLTPLAIAGFNAMRALSERNEAPAAASRPFSRGRDGFVLSEGAGVLVMEEYQHAVKRGARIYAEMVGFGFSSDGLHIAAPDPEGRGSATAMAMALQDARLNVNQIDYINAHGTGTPLGDAAETVAMKRVFGAHAHELSISSTKSQLGHLIGGSGGVEAVITALSIYNSVIPPTINFEEADPECDLNYTPNQARELGISYAMSNSFGFGGQNASIVFGAVGKPVQRQRLAA